MNVDLLVIPTVVPPGPLVPINAVALGDRPPVILSVGDGGGTLVLPAGCLLRTSGQSLHCMSPRRLPISIHLFQSRSQVRNVGGSWIK